MTHPEWHGPINAVLYTLLFERTLDENLAASVSSSIVARQGLGDGPAVYYAALDEALAARDLSGTLRTDHDPSTLFAFLARVRSELERAQPWPEPAFVGLPIDEWDRTSMQPFATIEGTTMQLADRLRLPFRASPSFDDDQLGLLLRLPSGRIVGLLGHTGPKREVVVMGRDGDDPGELFDELCAATGLLRQELRA
jgi:hypothetical protein